MSKSTTVIDPFVHPSEEFLLNPYPTMNKIRTESPIFWSEKGHYWVVTSYSLGREVLSDLHFEKGTRRFRSIDILSKLVPASRKIFEKRGQNMLQANPPDHTRLRGLVNKAFTPRMINQMGEYIETIANELLDKVQKNGGMDLVDDFAYPLPSIVIAQMLGIPKEDHNRFKDWSHTLTTLVDPNPNINIISMTKVLHAYNELEAYLRGIIEQRRAARKDDLISALVEAEEEGEHLNDTELVTNIVLLLIAGHETTANLIGNGTLQLLKHPVQLDKLKNNMDLMPMAVSECLRYDSPVQLIRRVAGGPTELGGVKVAEEETLLVSTGAANRDPEEFKDPDTFDISRNPNKHLSFGHGIHHCLGSALAELEGRVALTKLLTRMPNLRLATERLEYKLPFSLRGLKELPVEF